MDIAKLVLQNGMEFGYSFQVATATVGLSALFEGMGCVGPDCGGGELFPMIDVFGNATAVLDGGLPSLLNNTDFGTVAQGSAQQRIFTINNTGDAELTLGDPILTGPYSVVGGVFPDAVAAAGSAMFTLALNTTNFGSFPGSISFSTNVDGADPFNFDLAANVIPEPASITLFGLALIGMVGLVRRRS